MESSRPGSCASESPLGSGMRSPMEDTGSLGALRADATGRLPASKPVHGPDAGTEDLVVVEADVVVFLSVQQRADGLPARERQPIEQRCVERVSGRVRLDAPKRIGAILAGGAVGNVARDAVSLAEEDVAQLQAISVVADRVALAVVDRVTQHRPQQVPRGRALPAAAEPVQV